MLHLTMVNTKYFSPTCFPHGSRELHELRSRMVDYPERISIETQGTGGSGWLTASCHCKKKNR